MSYRHWAFQVIESNSRCKEMLTTDSQLSQHTISICDTILIQPCYPILSCLFEGSFSLSLSSTARQHDTAGKTSLEDPDY